MDDQEIVRRINELADEDPDGAQVRPEGVVEGYQQ
jgi:hypothetical protein